MQSACKKMGSKKRPLPSKQNEDKISLNGANITNTVSAIDSSVSTKKIKIKSTGPPLKVPATSKVSSITAVKRGNKRQKASKPKKEETDSETDNEISEHETEERLDLSNKSIDKAILNLGRKSMVKTGTVTIEEDLPPEVLLALAKKKNTITKTIYSQGTNAKVITKDIKIVTRTTKSASTLTTDSVANKKQVTFLVKNTRIEANKAKLTEKAPEFAKQCKIDELTDDQEVELKNEDLEVIKGVVSHINNDKVDEDIMRANYTKLLKIAFKLQIPSLEAETENYMASLAAPPPYEQTAN